ncbi:hypothetical protein KQX54_001094 [Cotesia glomerata]|uniref:Uncharacterized protein n=1 Tax=Cotesia glomerata TaxID=32391 RepID=A0AAV7IWG4_COTGL|nr:hypothetical protein KQX54_001094 [Cotesia glomerata]
MHKLDCRRESGATMQAPAKRNQFARLGCHGEARSCAPIQSDSTAGSLSRFKFELTSLYLESLWEIMVAQNRKRIGNRCQLRGHTHKEFKRSNALPAVGGLSPWSGELLYNLYMIKKRGVQLSPVSSKKLV